MEYSNTWVTIDLDAIEHNFHKISEKAKTPVCAVLKADAYGHGAVTLARLLEEQCTFFAVSSVAEALELRHAGIQIPLLLLGNVSTMLFPSVIAHNIRPAISCLEDAKALSLEAVRQNKTAYVHLAVDTGMSRIGFQATEDSAELCAQIGKLPNIQVEGLFSHFATADEEDLSAAKAQAELFDAFYQMLQDRGMEIPLRHLNNSAGILNFDCHYNMVRAGIVLYGLYPSPCTEKALPGLRPAMGWETTVSQVKLLEPGRKIGYGGTYTTEKPTMVATVPVGYADGYRRSLSGNFYVLIRDQKAPILGRICMDQMMVDVTHIPDVTPGDRVVLMGGSGDLTISAEELSAAAHSFNYEQVCDISHRVTRVYYKNGQKVHTVNYLFNKEPSNCLYPKKGGPAMQQSESPIITYSQMVLNEVRKAVVGKDEVLVWALATILAGGHILLEDIPGVGKTTMALAFSKALGLSYNRIQFNPDVLPSDVTGYSVPDQQTGVLQYRPGAVQCNLLLADELNRATSRTQSALLEAMEEGQVTVDGVSHKLPSPFMVIATQNPTGAAGTQLLPDSQVDRFMVRLSLGYPAPKDEVAMVLSRQNGDPLKQAAAVADTKILTALRREVAKTHICDEVAQYVVKLVDATRHTETLLRGGSPRATLSVVALSKAIAQLHGRDYVVPKDVQEVFVPVLDHRVQPAPGQDTPTQELLTSLMSNIRPPKLR